MARSTPESTVETQAPVNLAPARVWAAPRGLVQVAVAATAEGSLRSAFGTRRSKAPARVLHLSSSAVFSNPFVRGARSRESDEVSTRLGLVYAKELLGPNFLLFKHTLDWLVDDDDMRACTVASAALTH